MPETLSDNPEVKKPPEQIKADAEKVILKRKPELSNWMKITEDEVTTVKNELKQALGLPASEKISVTAPGDRAGLTIIVESATNPLRRYLATRIGWDQGATPEATELNISTASRGGSPRIQKAIKEACKIPADYPVDIEATQRAERTIHKVIDRETKVVLGVVDVDDETATIRKVMADEKTIEKLAAKPLKECMAALARDGRLRDTSMRKVVEDALRKEANLPAAFANRGLFISGKQNGDTLAVTLEDKDTEQVIAEFEYSLKSDEFTSQKVNKAAINRIVQKK